MGAEWKWYVQDPYATLVVNTNTSLIETSQVCIMNRFYFLEKCQIAIILKHEYYYHSMVSIWVNPMDEITNLGWILT